MHQSGAFENTCVGVQEVNTETEKKRIPGVKVTGRATALVSVRVSRFLLDVRRVSCSRPRQVPQIGK